MRAHAWKRHRAAAVLMVLVPFASTASADDGTYVVGVEPKTVSLVIHPGKINKDGAFISNVRLRILPGTASSEVAPHGYVIGHTKADTTYAIISVSDGNRLYQACDGAEGFTFTVPKGEAVYLGTMFLKATREGLSFRVAHDLANTKLQLSFTQQDLADRLTNAALVKMPIATGCLYPGGPTTIPIYVTLP